MQGNIELQVVSLRLYIGVVFLVSLVAPHTAWGASIACTGATSGNAGTCSTIANCAGTTETPANQGGQSGPGSSACPDQWLCCIVSGTVSPKDPKIPPIDPLPPVDPGDSGGGANQGASCTVPSGGTGQCEFTDQCSANNRVPTAGCLGGTVCCVINNSPGDGGTGGGAACAGGNGTCVSVPSECNGSVVNDAVCNGVCCLGSVGAPVNECTNMGGRCATLNGGCTTSETSSTRSCNDPARTCCMPSTTSGANDCTSVGGRCATINGGCSTTETSSALSCNDNSRTCCIANSNTDGTGTSTTTGSLECTGKYEKIAGVCFPTGTGLSEKSVLEVVAAFVGWLLAIFGFIALIGFVISGIQYLLSAGDEGMAETAKRNMKYSIIGIIVALSGWIIIKAIDTLLNASPWF